MWQVICRIHRIKIYPHHISVRKKLFSNFILYSIRIVYEAASFTPIIKAFEKLHNIKSGRERKNRKREGECTKPDEFAVSESSQRFNQLEN